jgi:hypothetical protein
VAKKGRPARKSRRKSRKSRHSEKKLAGGLSGEKVNAEAEDSIEEQKADGLPSSDEKLREEYAYVQQDLRRIAILAALMFVLLILLNILIK